MSAKDSITPTLRVCNCAGGTISETRLDRAAQAPGTASERGRLLTMGWTDGEMLVMVRERGGVEVRDIMVSVDKLCCLPVACCLPDAETRDKDLILCR